MAILPPGPLKGTATLSGLAANLITITFFKIIFKAVITVKSVTFARNLPAKISYIFNMQTLMGGRSLQMSELRHSP